MYFWFCLRSELHPTTCCLSIHISLKLSDFNPKLFNLSRWGVPSERGVIYHIQESSIQAWSIAAFHRRPRPPQCLVRVFNAVKLSQIKSETGNSSPPRDQSSCPSIASECQQMAETSSFLSRRRRYLFPLYLTLSSSLTNCLKRSKLIIGSLCLLLNIVYRQARKKIFSRALALQL